MIIAHKACVLICTVLLLSGIHIMALIFFHKSVKLILIEMSYWASPVLIQIKMNVGL